MFDDFPAGFEEFHSESIWTWCFPTGHFLESLINFFRGNRFVQEYVLFLGNQAWNMLDYPLNGLRSILMQFLGYPMEVSNHSTFDLLMGLALDYILVLDLQDFFVGSSGHGCSMETLGVPFSFP